MANVLNGNTFYIDTASGSGGAKLEEKNVLVTKILVTSNGVAGQLVLQDASATPVKKFSIRVPAAVMSELLDFEDTPILFPNGVDPTTVTNVEATLVFKRQGGGR